MRGPEFEPPSDFVLRARFVDWVRARMFDSGMTEEELGRAIGRRPDWLARFESSTRASRDLTLAEATRLVVLLGGDPDTVFRAIQKPYLGDGVT